jgi:hypothetical protein
MDALTMVSLEGNWDTIINARRVELAARAFREYNAEFLIVSGTYEPGTSPGKGASTGKLGERNTQALRGRYDIDPALIIPAHAFPFEFTYTTVEALANACVIGWLMSGLERQSELREVDFAPISSGAHCQRVHVLNVRACHALRQFNVDVKVKQQEPSDSDEPHMIASEARKLSELTQGGGVITTGRWIHCEEEWSFDDARLMRAMMIQMMNTVLPGFTQNQIRPIINAASLAQRYAIMQMLGELSANRQFAPSALDRILARTTQRFAAAVNEPSAIQIAEYLKRGIR